MQLRFRQLQAFHSIFETGTVTGAAEQLGISQPGISNLLAQLERQTGLELFERKKGRLIPTPMADMLFREVDTVVRGLDHVSQAIHDLQNKQAGQLQVAAPHLLSFGFMPDEIARFAEDRPDLLISFQSQYSTKIQEWVMAGLFEVAVCEMPVYHDTLTREVFHFETRAVLPDGHELARYDVLTPELLDNQPFIVMGPEHMTHRRTREVFESSNASWRPQVHTHLSENLLSFVKRGMGVALIDPFTVQFDNEPGYITRPFKPAVMLDLAVITSRNRPLTPVGQAFLEQLRESLAAFATEVKTA
ncbi:MAG: LysR family transcriptional regulator [Roseibium sp.]|uniref:LysR family transcriptional regulator n=1 Tax=Roseibium sp. TaxID=1936156 RepID=UPI001B07A6A7|nr:LysR family transcriptional regulator [Roseibium sp.]MBO6507786.1 LysR family transcriptional regulator [Roseibium sp.]MBO6893956.1 LysR family transcriptional regulator [Roseibium sp.]MBO6931930.1 LysR family transcriptional regulator [Roseibium sp.]